MAENTFKSWGNVGSELKAHSSALTNERISGLMVLIDESIIIANSYLRLPYTKKALTYVKQAWKNFRPVVRSSPQCRNDLKLDTKVRGVYTIDAWIDDVEKAINMIETGKFGLTITNLKRINREIENIEIVVRDVMQYFKFTFRTETRNKPDIFEASEKMSEIVDKKTEEDLLSVVGKHNRVQWSDNIKEKALEYVEDED